MRLNVRHLQHRTRLLSIVILRTTPVQRRVVDRVVVAGRFDGRFSAGVLLGEFVKVRVSDANLVVNLVIVVQYNHVRFVFVDVDTESVHGFLWSGRAWTGETPIRAGCPAARQAAGLGPMIVRP